MNLVCHWKRARQSFQCLSVSVPQCLRHQCNIVRIHGNVSECNLGGNTCTGDSLNDMVWKMPVEQDICHRFLKWSVVTIIPPLIFEMINDHKSTKPDHFSNCVIISRSFGCFLVYYDTRIPEITSPLSSQWKHLTRWPLLEMKCISALSFFCSNSFTTNTTDVNTAIGHGSKECLIIDNIKRRFRIC